MIHNYILMDSTLISYFISRKTVEKKKKKKKEGKKKKKTVIFRISRLPATNGNALPAWAGFDQNLIYFFVVSSGFTVEAISFLKPGPKLFLLFLYSSCCFSGNQI